MAKNTEILLSVIIPVYNSEKYLSECLSSLTRQDFPENTYEVIAVIYKSADKSEQIIDDYCRKYDYIKKIVVDERGISLARNIGIKSAKGKYITFMDADDFIANNSYFPIINIMEKENLNGFYFDSTSDMAEFKSFEGQYNTFEKYYTIPVWAVIYRRNTLIEKSIYFDERISIHEDFIFNYFYSQLCERNVGVTEEKIYYYRYTAASTSHFHLHSKDHKIRDIERIYDCEKLVCMQIKESIDKYNLARGEFYNVSISIAVVTILWFALLSEMSPKQVINDLKEHGIFLSDITIKPIEDLSLKGRIRSDIQFSFRYPFFYKLFCGLYRILPKKLLGALKSK